MSNIGEIVDVQIAIEAPPLTSEAFSRMLIVAPGPTLAATEEMPDLIPIRQAKELIAYGFSAESEAYLAAQVAFSQNPGPSLLYVTARQTETTGEGDDAITTNEALATTLDRAMGDNQWYGVCLAGYETISDITAAANWCNANSKLFGFAWNGSSIPVDITGMDRTFAIYNGDTGIVPMPDGNTYEHIALMAKCFGYEPGSETWANKTLNGVNVSKLTSAKVTALKAVNSNYYIQVANKNITQTGCVGSGEWIDTIRFMDWLIEEVQNQVYAFIVANTKVPYNDDGINGIQNQIEHVLKQGQLAGGIDDDRYDDNGEVDPGYQIIVPRAADVSASDRRARKLYGLYFIARLESAIHYTQIRGTLTY